MSREPSGQIESLLKIAGERDQPSADGMARAREAARRAWQDGLSHHEEPARPSRRNWFPGLGIAATFLVVLGIALWPRYPDAPVTVARVAVVSGDSRLNGAAVRDAAVVQGGDLLSTGSGRVAFTIGDSLSLRADRQTRLRFDAAGRVTLLEGTVYVDSGGLNGHTPLQIGTPVGVVRHVGTQFLVSVSDRTRVLVREGRVLLARTESSALDLGAGDLAEVAPTYVRIERGQPASGPDWEWAAATAPVFDIENRPLAEFLAWLAREHGWRLRYAGPEVQSRAADIRLHGAVTGLDANGMLERVMLITGVPLAVVNGELFVGEVPTP